MKISEVNIYGLSESIIASQFPMDTGHVANNFADLVDDLVDDLEQTLKCRQLDLINKKTAFKLAQCKNGTGHDNFLKGIIVQFNIEYKQYWSRQVQRYNFINFVSSQSTMHKLKSMGDKLPEYAQEKFKQFERGNIFVIGSKSYL